MMRFRAARLAMRRSARPRSTRAGVERAADDRAGDAARGAARAAAHVVLASRRRPTTITGIVTASASAARRLEVRAREHAVARDVGVDDRRDARVLEAAARARARSRSLVSSQPSHRDAAVARVDARPRCGPGSGARRSRTSSGSRSAAVPSTTRSTPSASARLDARRACAGRRRAATGTRPAAARIARTAARVRGPARARAVEIDHVQARQRVRGEARARPRPGSAS